jgi:hypothetical protein
MGFDNCYAVEYPGRVTELFTLEVVYNGILCGSVGSKGRLLYECWSVDHFDNCSRETWSLSTLNGILRQLDCHGNGKMQVYWLLSVTRVNSANVLDEGLRIGEIGRRMNSKVKLVETSVYRK